jgi:apolipoprotein N-acyltransferase
MTALKRIHRTTQPAKLIGADPNVGVAETKSTRPEWIRVVLFVFLSISAGALFGLAWRWEAAGWLGVAGIAIFLWIQSQQNRYLTVVVFAWLGGTTAFAVACPWLISTAKYLAETDHAMSVGLASVLIFWQGSQFVLFAVIWCWFRLRFERGWVVAPAIWVGLDQFYPSLFPFPPACLLTGDVPMLQIAEIGGVHLVSLLVVTIAGFLAWTFELAIRWRSELSIGWSRAGVWIAICFAILGTRMWGVQRATETDYRLAPGANPGLRVGLVQADTSYLESNERMIAATRAMGVNLDLAVWPESALGDYSRKIADFTDADYVSDHSIGVDTRFIPFPDPVCPLLAGADTWDGELVNGEPARHFVSAMLIDRAEHLIGQHDKVRLMPYGEFIPGEEFLPIQRKWFGSERVITAGTGQMPIGEIYGTRIGVMICCEDMHPQQAREAVSAGADLIVTIGNGMAFDSEIALRQHFRIAQLRAVENRRFFLRCTSRGVSGLIAPSGRVRFELPAMEDAACVVLIPPILNTLDQTPFTRRGRTVPILLALGLFLSVGRTWRRSRS